MLTIVQNEVNETFALKNLLFSSEKSSLNARARRRRGKRDHALVFVIYRVCIFRRERVHGQRGHRVHRGGGDRSGRIG